jgi:hypothetical protein
MPPSALGQAAPLHLRQEKENGPVTPLPDAAFAELGDPLFNLLLKSRSDVVELARIQEAIQPDPAKRHLFVVSEDIVNASRDGGRRAVIAFSGSNDGELLDGNAMLSVSFGSNGLPASTGVEAWGWDNRRQRYNYYKLDEAGAPGGTLAWKFRDSSERAELLTPTERAGTCLRCHVSGAPIMKELFFPWNNWHAGVGGSFKADYLDPTSFNPQKWPAASTDDFKKSLRTANQLEDDFLKPTLRKYAHARLNNALRLDPATKTPVVEPNGMMTVVSGRTLLRPLFETTDVNFYSSRNNSGNHPFGKSSDFVADAKIRLPIDQFFLNSDLIAGGAEGELGGLKIASARTFDFVLPTQQENRDLATKFDVRLANVRGGDTQFAWFVPGASYADNALIDLCLQQGVLTPHFLAAVLAVDLEVPVFSAKRLALLDLLPDQFSFKPVAAGVDPVGVPRDAQGDLLTQAVLAKLESQNPASGTPAAEFRDLLKSADAVTELGSRVTQYVARVRARLESARQAELERLYALLLDRRRQFEAHPILKNLDETNKTLLLPLPQ